MILDEFKFVVKPHVIFRGHLPSRSAEARRNSECCSSRPRCWTSQSVACRKSLARNFKQEQMDVRVGRHTSGTPLGLGGGGGSCVIRNDSNTEHFSRHSTVILYHKLRTRDVASFLLLSFLHFLFIFKTIHIVFEL